MGLYENVNLIGTDTGKRFGKWTQLGPSFATRDGWRGSRVRRAVCQCDCGRVAVLVVRDLRYSRSTQCNECRKAGMSLFLVKHGQCETREYNIWCGILKRCTNANHPAWRRYGGRGIKVCRAWAESFEAFLRDMGKSPTNRHEVHRIDNDGDYEPSNCKWAQKKENARNTSRTRRVEYRGKMICLGELSEITGIPYSTIYGRVMRLGWSAEKASQVRRLRSELPT